jgi:protein O-mannosyl-transferase
MKSDGRAQRNKRPPGTERAVKPARHVGGSFLGAAGWPWRAIAAAALLVALVLVVYAPVVRNKFIWDDDAYVLRNLTLRSLPGLWAIWFAPYALPQYYPLVHTTFWLEYHQWGLEPLGYHVTNVLLHAVSVVLVWRLFLRLRLPGAWLAAALFAVHPVMVESVAWATERKNVLSLALALGSMLSYLRFAPAEREGTSRLDASRGTPWLWYALALVLFVLALLSKTVVASMPAVLILIYWWKRGRVGLRDVLPLVPFFVVGAGLGIFTAYLETVHVGAQGDDWSFSPIERLLIAGRAVWFYSGKIVWPHPIVFFYRRWEIDDRVWWQYLFPLAALGLVVGLWLARKAVGRGPLTAVLVFGGVLTPAIGFLNVYPFRFSFVADHFQHHASLALFALIAAGLTLGARSFVARFERPAPDAAEQPARLSAWSMAPWSAATVLLAALAAISFRQTFSYYDVHSLYGDIIVKNPRSWTAYSNLGAQFVREGKKDEALKLFRQALAIDGGKFITKTNYGQALFDIGVRDGFEPGQLEEAIASYEDALRMEPRWVTSRVGLGRALIRAKRYDEAKENLVAALTIKPQHALALAVMGALYVDEKDWPESQTYFERAVLADPNLAEAHYGIGLALVNQGKSREAISHLQTALQLDPESFEAHYVLGNAMQNLKDFRTAVDQYREALRIKPDYREALTNLGAALGQLGESRRAVDCFEQLVELEPDDIAARTGLGTALLQIGKCPEAIKQFERALEVPGAPPADMAMISNNLAWLLATSADERFRDPARAQQLAREAVRIDPQSGRFWNTLGVVEYRAGQWDEAIQALEKSIELRDGGDATDRFVLALACYQAGRPDDAQRWYGKGTTWSARHQPISAEAKRFQQEAAQLLKSGQAPR